MKFGKQLVLLAYSSWQRHYVDYKALKIALKDMDALTLEAFLELVHVQFNRVVNFRDRKCKSENESLVQFAKSLHPTTNTNEDKAHVVTTTSLDLKLDIPPPITTTVDQSNEEGTVKQKKKKKKAQSEENTLRYERVMKLAEKCEALKAFGSVNETAFIKIWKKFLKKLENHLVNKCLPEEEVVKQVATARAAQSEFLEMIYEQLIVGGTELIENMTQILMALVLTLPKPSLERRGKVTTDIHAWQPKKQYVNLDLAQFPLGKITKGDLCFGIYGHLGKPVALPFIVARGNFDGPILCFTSAVHGNELNGIPLIHRLIYNLDVTTLCGTVICFPVVNVHGFARHTREWSDGIDINRVFPGKKNGNCSAQFAYHFMKSIVEKVDFIIDMHTASFGRANSLYIRTDMNDPVCHRLALLMKPEIIVHSTGPSGSLRDSAMKKGKKAITVEIADSQQFHESYIRTCLVGFEKILSFLKMLPTEELDLTPKEIHLNSSLPLAISSSGSPKFVRKSRKPANKAITSTSEIRVSDLDADSDMDAVIKTKETNKVGAKLPRVKVLHDDMSYGIWEGVDADGDEEDDDDYNSIICSKSYWTFTNMGGVLLVKPSVCEWVQKGQTIAEIRNLYGELIKRYVAPESGIVIGKSTNPVCQSGDRILHLGILGREFLAATYDGH
jgi:predicted deacylase